MGGDRPYTKAELQQRERDQQDPRWLAWLADMNNQIDRFLNETVPDMPDDPWSADGLRHAEQAALEYFPTMESVDLPENREVADRIHRFIGEAFRRNFEGEWYNVPSFDDKEAPHGFSPVIREGYNPEYLNVIQQLTMAMHRRTGSEWSRVFRFSEEDYAAWKKSSSTK